MLYRIIPHNYCIAVQAQSTRWMLYKYLVCKHNCITEHYSACMVSYYSCQQPRVDRYLVWIFSACPPWVSHNYIDWNFMCQHTLCESKLQNLRVLLVSLKLWLLLMILIVYNIQALSKLVRLQRHWKQVTVWNEVSASHHCMLFHYSSYISYSHQLAWL